MAQLKKHYPIEGRTDFFKWTIIATGESLNNNNAKLHTDYKGKQMYFDDKERAQYVCDAINKVEKVIEDDTKSSKRLFNGILKALLIGICSGAMYLCFIHNFPSLGAVITIVAMFIVITDFNK